MEPRYFEGYGIIKWLDPADYWCSEDGWSPVGKVGEYDDSFDIVINRARTEYRYTII